MTRSGAGDPFLTDLTSGLCCPPYRTGHQAHGPLWVHLPKHGGAGAQSVLQLRLPVCQRIPGEALNAVSSLQEWTLIAGNCVRVSAPRVGLTYSEIPFKEVLKQRVRVCVSGG